MSRCHRLLAPVVAYLLLVLPAAAEKRVALVVGNSAYVHATPLPNPVNDAGDMAKALTEVGFEVILGLDVDKPAFDAKVRDFARALDKADVALFFYAGHGLQASGRNYLVPVDASLQGERDLDFEAVSRRLRAEADGARARGQDQRRVPRRLPRQSAGAQPGPLHGHALGQHRPGPGAGADGGRHVHRLLDAAGQRRARRPGPQLAVHGRAGQGPQGARPQPHLGHDRGAQGRAGGDRRQAGAVGPFRAHRRLLFPPGVRAGHAAQAADARCRASRSGCASWRRS